MLKEALEQESTNNEEVLKYKLHGVNVNATAKEEKFVNDLFDSLASIPTGQKALSDMAKYGVEFKLESALGSAGGYFDPEHNEIVMAKSLGMDFMEFALVHEARHLLQNNLGRNEAEEQNLDYATRLMINRATEADAQTQAIIACKEWEAQGHLAPLKRFEKHYAPMINAYNKNQSLSDAFKGWYDDERIASSYEFGYDIEPALQQLDCCDTRPLVSMQPSEIAKFCGGDRVENFDAFMNSDKARQIHLLTQTCFDMYNVSAIAGGAERDTSIMNSPLRDLSKNADARLYSDKYIKETREEFVVEKEDTFEQVMTNSIGRMITAVEKADAARKTGKTDVAAEKAIENEKIFAYAVSKMNTMDVCTTAFTDLPCIPKEVSAQLKADFKDVLTNDPIDQKTAQQIRKDISSIKKSSGTDLAMMKAVQKNATR